MKIGIILHPYGEQKPGGLPRIIFGWAEALLSVDQKNEYIIFLKEKPVAPPDLPGKNWRMEILGQGSFWLERLRRKTLCDVYLFNTPVLPFFWRPPRSVVITLDYPYKYLKTKNFKEWLFRRFIGWYHQRSLKRVNHIIAVSHSTKNDTVKFFGVPPDKISLVYHGFKKICELPEQAIVLPEKFFFFAGTMKERKNILNIIKAYKLFMEKRPEAFERLVLGGKNEGEYYETLRQFVVKNNLTDKVYFTGHLNENQLSYAYRRAAALVFPSLVEGTGFPILEAMSCGLPVITSNIFGPAELGANGAAILINPREPKEIAEAMEKITSSDGLRAVLVEKSREQLKLFSWNKTGRETLGILEKITASKICFLIHNTNPHNGGGVLARNIISRLKIVLPASVQVLTAEAGGFPDELPLLSKRWFLSPFRIFSILKAIRSADFVHAFDVFPYGFIAALFSLGSKARIIITANGTGSVRYLYLPFFFPLAKFAFTRADKIIAISRFTRDEILKRIPELSILVINPGIDLGIFTASPAEKFLAKTRKFQPYILSVGSIRFRKGYKWSIPAFKKVSAVFPDLHYVIVGKKYTDKEYNRLKKLIDELSLKDKVFFVENVETDEELAAFYHGARLFGLLSFNVGHDIEGFGIVFTEAAAAGLPVVGSKNCGVEDSVKDNKNGFLVAEDDIEGFANAAIRILKDKKLYERMSVESRNFATQFSWEKKIDEYINLCYIT
ncbi:MAG: glycosyltransferase [Patescibacteria group bacterium]